MALWPKASTARPGGGHGRTPWRAAGVALVALSALSGVGVVGASFHETPQPPQPAVEAAAGFVPTQAPSANPFEHAHLARSEPASISIKRINLRAKIINLGIKSDGTLEVPPLNKAELAGWYSRGPSPGEIGNAVVVGHVTTAKATAVFFKLGLLRPKDAITITRKDGSTAKFTVDGVRSYAKKAFPTDLVYGPSAKPSLRLVTCGGDFNSRIHSYEDNVIVFATAAVP
ncbi:sortase family protein [Asanoa ferruginea]|uniref:Sortase family protein n=1 Tax=Asanoa ferruginea TaxID=53367 RepID=A0A3D9ZVE6_9ACTN|nr:class F sortase [Asanoa ferruginea]REG00900.1 sortase family protein [Asanoa ferruginea]GIF47481.1 class F sortase [Asanoa ferruginea]